MGFDVRLHHVATEGNVVRDGRIAAWRDLFD
jgi:cytidylate kinase